MNYSTWVDIIFSRPENFDPVVDEFPQDIHSVSENELFDYIPRLFNETGIIEKYSSTQIGNGLYTIFSNNVSSYGDTFVGKNKQQQRINIILSIKDLYKNIFEKLCKGEVKTIGTMRDGQIGFVCYMLWDIFILWPGSDAVTEPMLKAGLDVMNDALKSTNDCVLESALYGLTDWELDLPEAAEIVKSWLKNPTTANSVLIEYATSAMDET